MRTKFLSAILCTLAIGFALSMPAAAQNTVRTSATWRVVQYDITANIPAAAREVAFRASLKLINVSDRPASTLTLRISPDATVSGVSVGGSSSEFNSSQEKAGAFGTLQRLVLRPGSTDPGKTLDVAVDYKLKVGDNSGLASLSSSGSQFLPLSYWYPTPNTWYFSQGPDTAPVRIKVNADGQSAAASGADNGGTFDQKLNTEPFFVTGSWDSVNAGGVSVLTPKNAGPQAQKIAQELGAFYSDAVKFASDYLGNVPVTQLRIVPVRRGAGFSGGGTVLVDEAIFRRDGIDSQTAMNIAEAAVKVWIGGSAMPQGEGFGVTGEGLPRYIATQFIESRYGKETADVERMRQRNAYLAVSKRDTAMGVVSPLDEFYYSSVANKGAMMWRLLERSAGKDAFRQALKGAIEDRAIELTELRNAFSGQKDIVDYFLDKTTDMNLLIGIPQQEAGGWKLATRNAGSLDANVTVTVRTDKGEKLSAPTAVRAQSFGELSFKTASKVVRAEIDSEKLYPQIDYSDDIAPRDSTDSDQVLTIKKLFDKQDNDGAVKAARSFLIDYPRSDEGRLLLARALLALGRNGEAETEFKAIVDEKLPTARSVAWAYEGLAEIAAKGGQNSQASTFAAKTITYDAEYGAGLAARNLRSKLGTTGAVTPEIKSFFADFDKAATSKSKTALEGMIVPGEVVKFASGIAGSADAWQSTVRAVDMIDQNTALADVALSIRMLTKEAESGYAVYRLTRTTTGWKISGVEIFEVR